MSVRIVRLIGSIAGWSARAQWRRVSAWISNRGTARVLLGTPPPSTAAVGAFLLTVTLGGTVSWLAEQARVSERRHAAAVSATAQASRVREQLEYSMSSTYTLAALVRQGGGRIQEFERVAREMLPMYPGVGALQLAPDGVIRHVVPGAGRDRAVGHDLFADRTRSKEAVLALETQRLTLAGPFRLLEGGTAGVGRLVPATAFRIGAGA